MRFVFILTFFLILFFSNRTFCQTTSIDLLKGNWELVQVDRVFNNESDKDKGYYFFYDAYISKKPIQISNDGHMLIWRVQEMRTYDVTITQSEIIISSFNSDKTKKSETAYNYTLSNGILTLSHKDPILTETYTFKKI